MENKKRLIDANALIDEIDGIYQRHYVNSVYQFIHDFFRAVFRRIHKAPTVDAVEVVRCKDCAKQGLFTCPMCYIEKQTLRFVNLNPEFYCGEGERKDNG